MVKAEFSFPEVKKFKIVKRPIDFTKRPNPTPSQIGALNQEIFDLKITRESSYDYLMQQVRPILNKHIPFPNPGFKYDKIYNIPYSSELREEIRKKHILEKEITKSTDNWELFKIQRNLVTKMCKKETYSFYHTKFKDTDSPEGIQKTIKN